MIEHAADIRLRAEIKAGELLREMKERGERHKGELRKGCHAVSPLSVPPEIFWEIWRRTSFVEDK